MNAAHAADLAYAASGPPGAGGSSALVTQVLFFAAIFAIFYFLLIRPQQKQKRDREQMLSAIKKGDRIVTTGGLHGTVTGLGEHTVTVRVADQVKSELDRSGVGRIMVESSAEKDASTDLGQDRDRFRRRPGVALVPLPAEEDDQPRPRPPGRHPSGPGRGDRQGRRQPDRSGGRGSEGR